MGVFLKAAFTILREKGHPLTAKEIVDLAMKEGLLLTRGHTPAQTMKSKLSTDILRQGDSSLFMRADRGKFALREWSSKLDEFVADRFKKSLFDEDIVVFPAVDLQGFISGSGLMRGLPHTKDFLSLLHSMRRREAEADLTVIQLVSVFIVRHNDRILTFKRTKRLPESRLHGFYSLSFGGHLNPDDIGPLFNIFKPDQGQPFLMRELHEELKLGRGVIKDLIYRGLLYDASRPVSKQHLGITYEVLINSEEYVIGERGFLIDAKFETATQIESRINEFENWSQLLLKELGSEWR